MTFAEKVKTIFFNTIDEMAKSKKAYINNPEKNFIRNRKLNFATLMKFCISMESGNINHELLKFFDYLPNTPTCSAFCQQRSKLTTESFSYLLKHFSSNFFKKKYREKYFLIACDGSEFNIPRNPNDKDTFFDNKLVTKKGFNMIHTISLFDIINKQYVDIEFQPGHKKNEFQALCELMKRYSYGGFPIVIADRGFSSYNVFANAIENNIDFIIRAKDLNIKRLLAIDILPNSIDTTVEIFLTRLSSKKKYLHPEKINQYRYICKNVTFDFLTPKNDQNEYCLKLRITRFQVAEGIYENIITSLSDADFPINEIKELYNCRWKIETSFRDLKHTIGTTNFHSKKVEYIKQEIWSRLVLYNFCSIIIMNTVINKKNKKHVYQVNFSMSIKICFDFLHKIVNPLHMESLISKYILPIRLSRNYTRQHIVQHPASFCYRFV